MGKRKNKNDKFKVIDVSQYNDEQAKGLLQNITDDLADTKLKGIVAIVIPAKGRPLLYMNLRPEEGFLHTYRATGLIANLITAREEEEDYEDGHTDD